MVDEGSLEEATGATGASLCLRRSTCSPSSPTQGHGTGAVGFSGSIKKEKITSPHFTRRKKGNYLKKTVWCFFVGVVTKMTKSWSDSEKQKEQRDTKQPEKNKTFTKRHIVAKKNT